MRIVKFIGLKIGELTGLVLALYGLYWLGVWNPYNIHTEWTTENIYEYIVLGFLNFILTIIIITLAALVGIGLYYLIKLNWKWSGK